ncbi:hypothetical protein K0039_19560 [Terrisporobacter mayombei]|nr:hypothetical protein [Terrisporobacter mayombei]MCC3870396.1 hypothetical protein [Terrisporobacter mayombei]
MSEKRFQKSIKELGYKYNQKEKVYMKAQEPSTEVLNVRSANCSYETTKPTTRNPTTSTTLTTTQSTTIEYLTDNLDVLRQLLESYKRNTESNNSKDIIINLVNDKHLDPKPKSIRINEFVWRDWQESTKDLTFSKSDLISQALLEFMKNHFK